MIKNLNGTAFCQFGYTDQFFDKPETKFKMSKKLQDNQVSSTTPEIVFGETSKFTYSKSAREFCWTCQDQASVLGHSSVNCPQIICKNCLEHGLIIRGHHAAICLKPTRYWYDKTQIGINPYKKCTHPNMGIIPEEIGPVNVQKLDRSNYCCSGFSAPTCLCSCQKTKHFL
jgi:hypothetical protein